MKIAAWNIERLKHKKDLDKIISQCKKINADILVLTETDERARPDYDYCYSTPALSGLDAEYYRGTENRVSIFTNYKCTRRYDTYDNYTALCAELETEFGNLIVYGTIIGVYGNRNPSFEKDISGLADDIKKLSRSGKSICVCGDFNCSFSDNYYFTKSGRKSLLEIFEKNNISLLTGGIPECIDHIAVSDKFLARQTAYVTEWNYDKKLSDHKGIAAEFFPEDANGGAEVNRGNNYV